MLTLQIFTIFDSVGHPNFVLANCLVVISYLRLNGSKTILYQLHLYPARIVGFGHDTLMSIFVAEGTVPSLIWLVLPMICVTKVSEARSKG